ncbi:uncharacterized protein I206_101508 [Kwoniella pini CBS 10737]|uniref:Uncharacterized protein n=1 Tax=Kwoniella pini CBS 10737 TaxID=1296096 RepID=A0A1B9HWG2_9TREE|nr:uncharacterized protein I206_06519 [Kwoniella pini CBS 10737]OCF47616.1 hypothetical protein I206_06519 [Kwoniella pini CBS 10737]
MAFARGTIMILFGIHVHARVVPRGNVSNQGSPLLLGPNGNIADKGSDTSTNSETSSTDNDNSDTSVDGTDSDVGSTGTNSISASTTTSISINRSSDTLSSSITSTQSNSMSESSTNMVSSTSTSTSASASPSETKNSILPSDPPKQPSSIRYLVPVFLLILITIAGFGYQKYRKRKKRRSRNSMASKDFEKLMKKGKDPFEENPIDKRRGGGWKEIPTYEYNHDYDDEEDKEGGIWDSKIDDNLQIHWQNDLNDQNEIRSGLIRSGEFISAAEKGWGWKESWNNFKSARGKDIQIEIQNEIKEKQTMKLVNSLNKSSENTLNNLPIKEEEEEKEKEKDFKETIISEISKNKNKNKLERNKSPNKRLPILSTSNNDNNNNNYNNKPIMPEVPEWIRPRSVSPTNMNILSPPMQPHLFFHPISNLPENKQNEPSIVSEYSEFDEDDDDNITILTSSQSNTPIIPSEEIIQNNENIEINSKFPRIPSSASKLETIDSISIISTKKNKNNFNGNEKKYTSSGLSPLKRSVGLKNLSSSSSSGSGNGKLSNTLSPNVATQRRSKSNKRNKNEKKELKTRNQVEDILKASWSDRALITSPSSSPLPLSLNENINFSNHLNNKGIIIPGLMSPGLEVGNGIEQRLALLRNVQI